MKAYLLSILAVGIGLSMGLLNATALVNRQGEKVFIIDQKGVSWDVTQAKSLGFTPEKFQYGIGEDAFIPLDDSQIRDTSAQIRDTQRIIGIKHKDKAHAYSVDRLRYHEIANTRIGDLPISAGY